MMIIFWDQDGVLLTDYMPRRVAVNSPHYPSVIERLRSVILKKRRGKSSCEVLLLRDNAFTHKSTVVHASIRQADLDSNFFVKAYKVHEIAGNV